MRFSPKAHRRQWRRPVFDFHTIAQAALGNVQTILITYLPGGERRGNEYIVCNPRRDDRRLGSFKINLRTGQWADFAVNVAGGDLISLVAYTEHCGQWKAAEEIAELLCLVEANDAD